MTEQHEQRARDAFEALRADAEKVDTMRALHDLQEDRGRSRPNLLVVAAAAVVLIAAVVGGLLLANRDDNTTVIADDPDNSEQPSDGDAADGGPLADGNWVLSRGFGPDGDVPIVDGWPITIGFESDTFGGTAACNGYGGGYSTDGTSISWQDVSQTEMGCEGPAMASEAAFLSALLLVDSFELADGLLLSGPGVELMFSREAPVPTADLVGQLWLLDTLIQGETASSVQGDPATLLLDADGNVRGGTGCRTFTGSYVINGGSVLLPDFAMDGECPVQLTTQDNQVVTVLGDGFTPSIDGDRLTLTSAGNEGLGYKAIEDDELEPSEPETEPLTAADLQGNSIEGDVVMEAFLVDAGGGWYLCDEVDTSLITRCRGAWVPVVHVDQEILEQFGPKELGDDLGTWRQTEEPVLLSGRVLVDGRLELDDSSVSSQPTDADADLASMALALDPDAPNVASLPFSPDGVTMGLGNAEVREVAASDLADPANWAFELEGFRGRTGTFSALAALAQADQTEVIVGTHNHCASPPTPIPAALRDARRVSIQPTGIDSCIDWWTVGLYLDDAGEVVGIVFDTWEP